MHPAKTKQPHLDAIQLEKGTWQKIFELIVNRVGIDQQHDHISLLDNAGVLERLERSTGKRNIRCCGMVA